MIPKIKSIPVQITRFVDDSFPGWVECEFLDAEGRRHHLIDKVPIFTTELLDATSTYPTEGIVRCEVLERSKDDMRAELVRVTTARPDTVESTEGLSEFVVFATQLHPDPWPL
jgi:hypothetical protein